jgi:thiamine biosynthesis lipoprotein
MLSLQGHGSVPERNPRPTAMSRRAFFRREAERPVPPPEYWVRVHRRAMACRFEVTLADDDARHIAAARCALDEVDQIESRLTVFRESSLLSMVNRRASNEAVPIDEDLLALLRLSVELHRDTGGAFDVTTTPLSRCWGFLQRSGRLPAQEEIDRALSLVGMDGVVLDAAACTVRFQRPGVELNLGSIGKGWALDTVARGLEARRVPRALLSAGGSSVLALGHSRAGWPIDVTSSRASGARLARLHLQYGALGTSGAGEQFVEVDGKQYGHVIDPRTGWPAFGVVSASVVADDAAIADALSTAFLVAGPLLAERYCATHPNVLALVTPDDGSLRPLVFGDHPGVTLERV